VGRTGNVLARLIDIDHVGPDPGDRLARKQKLRFSQA